MAAQVSRRRFRWTRRGNFTVSNALPQSYTIAIKGAKWLQKTIPADSTNGPVVNLNITLPAGDANNDNSVDTSDFAVLLGAYNGDATIPGSGYDPAADFNGDGAVDASDFALLVGNYNAEGAM